VPKRSRPTTRSPAPGRKWQAVATAEQTEEEEHIARIRKGKEAARREEREQVAAAAVPVSPPPMPPPSASPSMSRKSSKISAVAIGTVTLQAAASIPKASSSQVYSCSANQDNMQQCTMLSTDDGFPWGAVILLTILLTTLFTTIITLAPMLLSRWSKRRGMPVVEEKQEEEVAFSYPSPSQSSQDIYTQTEVEPERRFVLLSDASTQALDWQSFSNDELHDEIAFRLSDYHFAMSSRHAIPLVLCFERKDTYKAWGATYNDDAKQWYFPPGTDLRGFLRYQPSWLQNPELLRREILLRIMSEIDRSPTLVR